jgi:hypothetical protein
MAKYTTEQWPASEDNSFSRMVIDKKWIKWMGTNRDGLFGFNENGVLKNNSWARY